MKLHYTIIVIFLIPLSLLSQVNESAYLRMVDMRVNSDIVSEQYGLSEDDLKSIEGSPYENDAFLPGAIYTSEKVIAGNVLLRYNILSDEIEMKKQSNANNKEYSSLIKDPKYFAKIRNDIYVFVMKNGSIDEGGYFKVLSDGEHYDLYKKVTVEFIEKTFAKTSYGRDTPAQFKREDVYYLVSNDKFYELPNKKNKLIDVFNAKESEVKKYIKSENLNIKEEADLIKVINYYNSIL